MDAPERITIVGAGLMGHGLAQVFAVSGHRVCLVDTDERLLATAGDRIRHNLETMAAHGLADLGQVPAVLDRVRTSTDLTKAAEGVDVVVEAVYENLALKQDIFARLDELSEPGVVLCTNTSVMSVTEIGARAEHRERIVGTHFWNPPFLIPLVEVVRTEYTAGWCVDATMDLMRRAGKQPVSIRKDVPGFVGNRLQHALWREAFALVDEGVCDVATIDGVIANSFGMRLPVLGPAANADLIGLDLTLAVHEYLLPHLSKSSEPSTTLRHHVEQGHLGFKTGRGFLSWSADEIEATRSRLADHLMSVLASRQMHV